jgi:hypothetical protein
MPDYRVTIPFEDDNGGSTQRIHTGTFADDATATTAATALADAYRAASGAEVGFVYLTKVIPIVDVPTVGATVFERAVVSVVLDSGKRHSFELPAPEAALKSGNAIVVTDALWTDLMDQFDTEWEVSDGENIDVSAPMSGQRKFRASGKSNLL